MTTVSSATATTPNTQTNTSSATSTISSDFTTFLQMLTTQMQNQDPTDPIESSDYAAQLATFSQVEQQVKTNDLLSTISSALGIVGLQQYASWVGMETLSAGPVSFNGTTPLTLTGAAASNADQAVMVITDASGNEVARKAASLPATAWEWDGTDSSGAQLPAGNYSFSLESYAQGSLQSTDKLQSYHRIVETRMDTGGAVLVLANGAELAPSSVSTLREAR